MKDCYCCDGLAGQIHQVLLFECERNRRARNFHYVKRGWPSCPSSKSGKKNVQHPSLVESNRVLLLSLHIKLGLLKKFIKTMDKTGQGFHYLIKISQIE